jgi:nucleotide-binding universal stress UspA family protein
MTTSPTDPLILCYDGSEDAKHAIERAGVLFPGGHALVLTVWQTIAGLGSFAWSGATATMVNFVELDRAAAEDGGRIAEEGVRLALKAGLEAEPLAVKATGPVWEKIVETADHRQAAVIVMGSRGLTGLRSVLLGSVSSAVVHHGHHPTLVIHRGSD